jgi:2-keto-4-pentenoate hydratase/2-oxohepta-3-ene-1,7-dioic acid hydratase in catechol pathway
VALTMLQLNGEFKQNGNTEAMITRIPGLIAHVSSIMTLEVNRLQYLFAVSDNRI